MVDKGNNIKKKRIKCYVCGKGILEDKSFGVCNQTYCSFPCLIRDIANEIFS